MPRNGSGVYSKPAGTTAITNTIIDPVPWNALTTDLGNEITNSLPRDGSAGMIGAFQAANGTNATPSMTFVSDTGTGIYRKAASTGAFVSAGAEIANWSPSGFSVASALSVTGGFSAATITATSGAIGLPGALFGLTLSNDPGDLVNDIAIAAGAASSDASTPFPMVLATAITKRLDAAWAVGTNQGGLDTGSIANGTYHLWLIQRSDTGVVDALFSISASSPTIPANYDRKRRIGSIIRSGATILAFTQRGDVFTYTTPVIDRSSTAVFADALLALTVPSGIVVSPIMQIALTTGANTTVGISFGSGNSSTAYLGAFLYSGAAQFGANTLVESNTFFTNTSSQIRLLVTITAGTFVNNVLSTVGWVDTRGRI